MVYGFHSMGIKYQNNVICATGANYVGQLGNGTTANQNQFECNIGSLNISNILKEKQILVYPNPVFNEITFTTESNNSELSIFNNMGQIMMHIKLVAGSNTVQISNYTSGLYYYNIETDKGKVTSGKFIKK